MLYRMATSCTSCSMYKIVLVFLSMITATLWGQTRSVATIPADAYQAPLDMELQLAGNYGELRPNHFHAGLDFKTQSTTGYPVYAFADGYVSRIGINAYGYGLVVYLRHPQLGVSTVYAHLSAFDETIMKLVRERQVAEELNNADIFFTPDQLPVKKGQIIAKSGNTGSSGGPHVHFEIRDCNDDDDAFFDPMPLFVKQIADTKAPQIEQIYLYPLEGVSNGRTSRVQSGIVTQPGGSRNLARPFTAWGKVGLGIKAFDKMDGQGNIFGVKNVKLYLDDKLIYCFSEEQFRYSERRYTNSLIDYEAWIAKRSTIMKSFIDPGNKLQMLDFSLGDGTVMIDEERAYNFRYELTDAHGNKTTFSFPVKGKKSAIPAKATNTEHLFTPGKPLSIDTLGCQLSFPATATYSAADITVRRKPVTDPQKPCVSDQFVVGSQSIPLHDFYELTIPLPAELLDTLTQPQQLFIVNLDGGIIGGKYEKGKMTAKVREFGSFAVRYDRSMPIAGISQMTWNTARISVGDSGSGVAQFKVFIDDKFVPFDMDNRGRYMGHPRYYGITKGKTHKIRIWVIDKCGNETTVDTTRYF